MSSSIQQGHIILTVHRAESLVGLNTGGTSNPFVVATIGNQSYATSTITGTVHPVFESTFTFTGCALPTILTLKVCHKGLSAEELLGSATLTLFGASPMTRRTVQLSHGGDLALSQRARDGCGSLDVSYEVTFAPPSELPPPQGAATRDEIPAFLREESAAMNFTSAYAALSPPDPSAFPPAPQHAQLPQTAPMPAAAVPLSKPTPPSLFVPPPIFGEMPLSTSAPSAAVGPVATAPAAHSAGDRVTPQTPDVTASLPPPSVPALQTMPANTNAAVALGVEAPRVSAFPSVLYPNAANAPAVRGGQSLLVLQPSIHGSAATGWEAAGNGAPNAFRPSAVATPPSLHASVSSATSTNPTRASTDTPAVPPSGLADTAPLSLRPPPPLPAAASPAEEKPIERPKRKAVVVADANATQTGKGAGKGPREAAGRRRHSLSPTKGTAATNHSANRSSSRGRHSSPSATAGAGIVPALYQQPEELLAAAMEGDVEVFRKLREGDPLLSRGFENVRDYSGRTVLHLAAWHGHTEVLKVLLQPTPVMPMLELRALRSHNGNTILHSAAQGGQAQVVQWLRFGHTATGTLLGLRNARGQTATECSREAGFTDIVLILSES